MSDETECLPFITFAFVNTTTFLTKWECKDFSQFLTQGVFFFETKEHSSSPLRLLWKITGYNCCYLFNKGFTEVEAREQYLHKNKELYSVECKQWLAATRKADVSRGSACGSEGGMSIKWRNYCLFGNILLRKHV